MNELKELKKQNKQLKKLLENAVELLNRYKHVLEDAGTAAPPATRTHAKAKRAKKKASKS